MNVLRLVFGGLLALFYLAAQPAYAQNFEQQANFEEEEAVFDEEAVESDGHPSGNDMLLDMKQKYNFKLYLDFMYEESLGDDENFAFRETENPSFSSNHTYLLLQAAPTEKLRVGFDVFRIFRIVSSE